MAKTAAKSTKASSVPDPFIGFGAHAAQVVHDNAALVGAVVVVGILVGALVMSWPSRQDKKERIAAAEYYAAQKAIVVKDENPMLAQFGIQGDPTPESLKAAAEGFEKAANAYPGTHTALRAWLAAGDAHLRLKDYEKAEAAYRHAEGHGTPAERYSALAGLAAAQEGRTLWSDAAATYRRIVGDTSLPFRDDASLALARVLGRDGKQEEARALLKKFEAEFPDSQMIPQIPAYLSLLGATGIAPAAPAEASAPPAAGAATP